MGSSWAGGYGPKGGSGLGGGGLGGAERGGMLVWVWVWVVLVVGVWGGVGYPFGAADMVLVGVCLWSAHRVDGEMVSPAMII